MIEPPSPARRVVGGALLLVLGVGCAGPSGESAHPDSSSAVAPLPSWLDDAHPAAQLELLPGDWCASAWITRRTGRTDRDGPLDLLVAPLLDGRLLVGLWTGTLANRPQSGLDLLAWDGEREVWELLSYWPIAHQAGFERCAGRFRHGRLELQGRDADAQGRSLATRTTLADLSPVSLRWDRAVSADEGVSWATVRVFELQRQGDPTEPVPDLASLCARDAVFAVASANANAGAGRGSPAEREDDDGARLDPDAGSVVGDAFDAPAVLGRWAGSLSRLQPEGRWTTSPCRYEATSLLGGMAILDVLQEQGENGLPGLARVSLWGRLGGSGRRLDRKGWEIFRHDDRTARSWSFAGDFREGEGEFVHPDEHGRPQVRVVLSRPELGRLAWVEATSEDGGLSWTERLRIDLVRDA